MTETPAPSAMRASNASEVTATMPPDIRALLQMTTCPAPSQQSQPPPAFSRFFLLRVFYFEAVRARLGTRRLSTAPERIGGARLGLLSRPIFSSNAKIPGVPCLRKSLSK